MYERKLQTFNVADFKDYQFEHPAISRDFLNSVHEYGIIQPPVLGYFTENRKRFYKIISGQRRIAAFMQWAEKDPEFPQEFEAIVIMKAHKIPYNELIIIANTHDNPNPFTDLAAVKHMIRMGMDIKGIAKAIFKTTTYVQNILVFDNLPHELLAAGEQGEIAEGTLRKLAKKPATEIKTALEIFEDEKKLTGKQVDNLTKVHKAKLVKQLYSEELYSFDQEDADDEPVDNRPYVLVEDGKITTGIIKGYENARSALMSSNGTTKLYTLVPVQ